MTEATGDGSGTDVTEGGGATRVAVAGLTAPPAPAPEGPVPAGSASEAPSGEGVPEAEPEEAVAEVVEIPRQQSAGTAADTDSETGEPARR
ncbi:MULTISPECIES: hypothetical protein [unclassified Streptomyces]|uniref:hypothetical protein n=1 Tax=unclassified Streptomyces TaxID=2593676 RepID=UPI00331BDC6F